MGRYRQQVGLVVTAGALLLAALAAPGGPAAATVPAPPPPNLVVSGIDLAAPYADSGRLWTTAGSMDTPSRTQIYSSATGPTLGEMLVPKWSRDGSQVLFVSNPRVAAIGPAQPQPEVYALDVASGNVANISNTDRLTETAGAWSPDSTRVATTVVGDLGTYAGGPPPLSSKAEIRISEVDGSGSQVIFTTRGPDWAGVMYNIDWTPDGQWLVFDLVESDFSPLQLWRIHPDGTGLEQLTYGDSVDGSFIDVSTNNTILTVRNEASDSSQHLVSYQLPAPGEPVPAGGLAPVLHTAATRYAAWSPDGARIAFYDYVSGSVATMDADGTNVVPTAPVDAGVQFMGLDWGPSTTTLDTVSPTVTLTAPGDGIHYRLGQVVTASYACSDDVDPAPTCQGTMANGAALPTGSTGTRTFTVTSHDTAGNTAARTATYYVDYAFTGFSGSVDSVNVNKAKAGSAVPFKFHLADAAGAPVLDLSGASLTSRQVACGTLDGTLDAVTETTTGAQGLKNLGGGDYMWNWSTPKTYANTCRIATLLFGDGGAGTASFQFTK